MKNTVLLGLLLGLFFLNGCQEKAAEGGAGSAKATAVDIPLNLEGYWVNAAWWQELKRTKSPRQALAKAGDISAAIFQQDAGKWVGNMSYNWHEGQQLTLREKDGALQLYDPNDANVKALPLVPRPDGSLMLDKVPMLRLAPSFEGIKVIGNTVLGGQYDLDGRTVVFNPNGTVVGLDGFNYYELLLDYIEDETGADQLSMSQNGGNPRFFAFKLEGGHLLISELEEANGQFKVGRVKYDLAKK